MSGQAGRLSSTSVPQRQVAFTFDDIPGIVAGGCNSAESSHLNRDLVAAIKRNRIPALGVVVESRGCTPEHLSSVFNLWLDAGVELGNHTASHHDFNNVSLDEFERDTIDGEKTLKPLLEKRGRKLRYFRFPMLHTGNEPGKKQAFAKFLRDRGYTNAVVTIDNDDYVFAWAYLYALGHRNAALASRIATHYIAYMERIFAFYEHLSRDTLGYELPQILLLHDNQLNADHLDDLVALAKRRNYKFVNVDDALRDPAYRKDDTYVGSKGVSWLYRWAGDRQLPDQPAVEGWIEELGRKGAAELRR